MSAAQGCRTALVGGTLEGGYSLIIPLDEQVYWRLYALHTQLTYVLPHVAGLNPRAYRSARNNMRLRENLNACENRCTCNSKSFLTWPNNLTTKLISLK